MTNTEKSLLWAFAGTVTFIVAGFAAFIMLAFILGPGIDIDGKGTTLQKLFGAAALPALYYFPFGGTLVSWTVAFVTFRADESVRSQSMTHLTRIFIIGFLLLTLSACDPTNAGPFDRKQMESLVSQVRLQPFSGEKIFRWKEISGVATLVVDQRQRQVWAIRDKNQRLIVVIFIQGGSHYGAGGFAYSDAPFVRSHSQDEAPPGGCTLNLPGPLQAAYPKKQIDAHWWPVFDNVN